MSFGQVIPLHPVQIPWTHKLWSDMHLVRMNCWWRGRPCPEINWLNQLANTDICTALHRLPDFHKHPLFISEPTRGAHSLIPVREASKHVDHCSNEREKAEIGWGLIILIHFIFIWIFLNNSVRKKKGNFATVIHLNWLKNKIDYIVVILFYHGTSAHEWLEMSHIFFRK